MTQPDPAVGGRALHDRSLSTVDPTGSMALVALAQDLGEARSEQQLLAALLDRGVHLLGARAAALWVRGSDGRSIRSVPSPTTGQVPTAPEPVSTDQALPNVRAAVEGRSSFFPDRAAARAAFPAVDELYAAAHVAAAAELPLRSAGRLLGSLSVYFDAPHAWEEPERELFGGVAVLVAQALERVHARTTEIAATTAAAAATHRLRLVTEVSDAFGRDADAEAAVMGLARVVVPALADWCTITLAPSGGDQRTVGWAHREPAQEPALARYATVQAASMNAEAAVAVCLRTGGEVITVIPELNRWVGPDSARALLAELRPRSVAVLPLSAGGRTLGAMALVSTSARQPLTPEQLVTARDVAQRAGLALDNLQLRDRAALLGRVTDQLSSTLEADQAVGRLARLVVPALADWCIVSLVDDDDPNDSLRAVHDVGSWHVEERFRARAARYAQIRLAAARNAAFVRQAMTGADPVVIPPRAADALRALLHAGEAVELIDELAPEHGVVLPLRARGRTVGLLSLFTGPARGVITADDLATATEAAARAALALDNARLYRQQRDLATTLQRSLLTPPPQPDGLEIAVRYQPATAQAQVGGDWYDAFSVADGGLLLVVGDVAGHDRDAAAQMAQVRNVLRGVAQTAGGSPAAVLGQLDAALDRLDVRTMATAVVCRLETGPAGGGGRVLRWSNAGHPAPLLIGPGGHPHLLTRPPNMLLGVLPTAVRDEHTAVLLEGATLVLYTDGLIEGRRQSLDRGEERLLRLAADLDDLPPQAVCDAIVERLAVDAEDDVAVLVMRC